MTKSFWLIGCGGIGSKIVFDLVRLNKEKEYYDEIHLVDGDLVEQKNLLRQDFDPDSVVVNKAEALKSLLPFKEGVFVHPVYLSQDNIKELIDPSEDNHIILAVDNYKTRKVVNDYFNTLNRAFILSCANDFYNGNVQMAVREAGIAITPDLTYQHPEIEFPDDKSPDELSCDELVESDPQLILTNRQAATTALILLWQYNEKLLKPCRDVYFNIKNPSIVRAELPSKVTT